MTEQTPCWCVLIPCSENLNWALPQNCLGEIVSAPDYQDTPPKVMLWRGCEIPVIDLGDETDPRLGDRLQEGDNGLVAVVLGLQDDPFPYWGLQIHGTQLAVKDLSAEPLEDIHQDTADLCSTAFQLAGDAYQVPDLAKVQNLLSDRLAAPA